MSLTPAELARVALRRIAELQIPPTPENYSHHYVQAGGTLAGESSPATAGRSTADAQLMNRVDALLGKAVQTTETLSTNLDEQAGAFAGSLEAQVVEPELALTVTALLRVVAQRTKDIQATVNASQAELMVTRRSLSDIQAELIENRKLLDQDALTGTDNRRAMDAILAREMARSRRDLEPMSVVMVDIDHFKAVNDTHGHVAGDAALMHLTRIAKSLLRGNDAFVRYGGEEFLLVLPETALQGGVAAGRRLQAALQRNPLVHAGKTIVMTLSGGVATLTAQDTEATLIERADAALYRAKNEGRNRVLWGE